MAVLYFLKTHNLKQNVIKSIMRIVLEKPQRIAQYLRGDAEMSLWKKTTDVCIK